MAGRGFTFDHVCVEIDDRVILDDIDLVVPTVGITAIQGPSGSGKSTLLRLCNRLEVPSRGRVLLDGVDLAAMDARALRRRVGMVFQRPVTFAGDVRENLHVAAPTADDDVLVAALERVGLDRGVLDQAADTLSGGEAQRMCICRTLLTEPEVVLFDESTSSLDPENTALVETCAARLVDRGTAIVWVTHDAAQAQRVASRRIALAGGRVVAGGAV